MPYDNSQRSAAARETRTAVLGAAHRLFLERGFGATTVRLVADSAGVSQETIYKAYGNKATLLKAVYDVSLAGDDADVPISERPEAIAVWEAPDADAAAVAFASFADSISARIDPLLRVLLGSRDTDAALRAFAATIDGERLVGARVHVGHWQEKGWLRADLTLDRAAESLWAINSPQPRWLLLDQGWSREEFTVWLADTLRRAVLT